MSRPASPAGALTLRLSVPLRPASRLAGSFTSRVLLALPLVLKEFAMIKLGMKVEDVVTGFRGCCVGLVDYLSGCRQALVVPQLKADGSLPDSQWFDVQRLTEQPGTSAIVLENGPTPGFDRAPPKR